MRNGVIKAEINTLKAKYEEKLKRKNELARKLKQFQRININLEYQMRKKKHFSSSQALALPPISPKPQ